MNNGSGQLIYDVGVENGDDSAYYLHKGYRVVGVEASPIAVEKLNHRFRSEIADGRYTLLPFGIADKAGEAQFWVCDDHPQWSSFDREIASRGGARHHPAPVQTVRFRSILERFGRAAFCKIDIEGNDNLCVEDFTAETRPPYVSVELIDGEEQLRLLQLQGYRAFKILSQRNFEQPSRALLRMKRLLPESRCSLVTAVAGRLGRERADGVGAFRAARPDPSARRRPARGGRSKRVAAFGNPSIALALRCSTGMTSMRGWSLRANRGSWGWFAIGEELDEILLGGVLRGR